jgi:hypothetical protein
MSDEANNGTDRRALLAAAAAGLATAGAAVQAQAQPKPTMDAAHPAMIKRRGPATVIKVDLGGAHLPEGEAAELEKRIRSEVLATLGRANIRYNEPVLGPHPGWIGIIIRPVLEGY